MKGKLLTYEVPTNFYASPQDIADAGFKDFAPRNKFKGAFIAALRKVYTNDRFYRRFNDSAASPTTSFACFLEERSDHDVDVRKELIAVLDKKTGKVEFQCPTEGAHVDLQYQILTAYKHEIGNCNGDQFRSLIKNLLRSCYAVSIKSGSSVFFIDKKYEAFEKKIHMLAAVFPEIKIISWVMGDDDGANTLVKNVVKKEITKGLSDLILEIEADIKSGTLTTKKMENKVAQVEEITKMAKEHAHNLMEEAESILNTLIETGTKIAAAEEKAEFLELDFLDQLAKL